MSIKLKTYPILLLSLFIFSCNNRGQSNLPNKKENFSNQTVNKVIEYNAGDVVTGGILDQKGQLWFATSRHGVYCYNGESFTNLTTKDGLCNNEVFSILEDKKGNLWFGTSDGICHYDGEVFTHIPIPWERHEGTKSVLCLFQDKDENIWVGTWGGGAYLYDGKEFTSYLSKAGRLQENGLHNNVIRSIIQDKEGYIWIASLSHGGVTRYDGKTFINFLEKDGLCDDMVFASFQDKAGNFWFGGNEGGDICRYDGDTFTHFGKEDGVCNTFVSCFFEDSKGRLWISSDTENSLCYYNGETFTPFSAKGNQDLPEIRFVLEDKKGTLWFGGRYGSLWSYNGDTLQDFTQAKNG